MKNITRLTCLGLFCVGAASVGYEITLHFGSAVIFFFAALALATPSGALCAPEGYERADGFHVYAPNGRCGLVGGLRLFQRQLRREWT
jgi:hypothetical protein